MADIVAELTTYLKTQSPVTDLVGTGTAARIYEEDAKQGTTLPYIVLEVFEGETFTHLTGLSGLARNRVQIDSYGSSSTQAHSLAEAIRLAIAHKRVTMGSTQVREHGNGSYERGRDQPVRGGGQRRWWVSRDYIFTYNEPTS